jgi:hypothetical protein
MRREVIENVIQKTPQRKEAALFCAAKSTFVSSHRRNPHCNTKRQHNKIIIIMPPFSSKKKKEKGVYPVFLRREDPDKALAYINLTILDASEAVYSMVHSKIREKQAKMPGPERFKKKVAKSVAKAASNRVPPSTIAKQLSTKLPKKLMYMMYQKTGMKMAAQTVFVEDAFVVMQLQVQYVDSVRLLSSAKEKTNSKKEDDDDNNGDDDDESVATQVLDDWIEEQSQLMTEEMESAFVTTTVETEQKKKSDFFECFKGGGSIKEVVINILEWILIRMGGTQMHQSLEEKHLPALVQSKITENMQEMMAKKLESKSLKAETVVLSEVQEARYFFNQLQKVRSQESASSKDSEE